jgi:vitamin B12 transporter
MFKKMNKKLIRALALCVLVQTGFWAQNKNESTENQLDEVVVSDSKFALSKEKSGKVISKITAEMLSKNPGQSVANLLSMVAGVEINGNQNGAGKNLGYFIRGGRSSQVLILVDGIPMVDASGISIEFDLRLLSASQVESVEVMKGAASTLYGSGAATGVINIVLKKSAKKKFEAVAFANGGSNNTATVKNGGIDFNSGVSISGSQEKVNYLFSINNTEMNGVSQIAQVGNTNYETDRFSRTNLLGKFGIEVSKKLSVTFFGNYDKLYNDYDLSFNINGNSDTNKNKSTVQQFRFGFLPKLKYDKGELNANVSWSSTERNYLNFDNFANSLNDESYRSRNFNGDVFNKYVFTKNVFVVLGTQYQFYDMGVAAAYDNIEKESTKFNMVDPYTTVVLNFENGLNFNVGGRMNHHSEYGNAFVYNVNPSFGFKKIPLKILASASTAFVTPSLYQLYSQYGNTTLTPEKNQTFETGFETQLFNKKIKINSVAFFRTQTNFIGFYYNPTTFQSNYINIEGENKAKGVETEVFFEVSKNVKLNANYTFTEVDAALDRLIPKHKINVWADVNVTKKLSLNAGFQYFNQRNDLYFDDSNFSTQKAVLAAYKLFNATANFDLISNRLSVFGTVTNIFNENFVESIGYSTRGRNFRVGMNFRF